MQSEASTIYLNGDPNYPEVGGGSALTDYADRSSACTISGPNDQKYIYTAINVIVVANQTKNIADQITYFFRENRNTGRVEYTTDNINNSYRSVDGNSEAAKSYSYTVTHN